jgi:D-alanyl-D-alanine carboxypeptidase
MKFIRLPDIPRSILLILSFVSIFCGCGKDSRTYPEVKLMEVVDEFSKDQEEILGIMVQIDIADQGSYRRADGFADIHKKTAVQPGDKFLIGSSTIMFTATLVHQLIEEGAVGPDDPIIDHLSPDWAAVLAEIEYGREITVSHALSHRSGIYDTPSSSEFFAQMVINPSQKIEPRYMLELARDNFDPNFKPGESFAYASLNYILLGNLIENVTQKPYDAVLRERIIDKIGLTQTYLSQGTFGSNREGVAHGYMNIGGQAYDGQEFDSGWAWTAGAIISNNDDLIRFIKALAGGQLFRSEDTFKKMHTVPEGSKEYGFGLVVLDDPLTGESYGHIGFFGGTSSIVCYLPEKQTAISICINFAGSRSSLRAIDLMDMILRAFV